jgi:hypothetical protein
MTCMLRHERWQQVQQEQEEQEQAHPVIKRQAVGVVEREE